MGLTRAEKHNKMLNETFEFYYNNQKSLPPCNMYKRFLDIAVEKFNITKDEARNKYGQYTIGEWETMLKLGWNK